MRNVSQTTFLDSVQSRSDDVVTECIRRKSSSRMSIIRQFLLMSIIHSKLLSFPTGMYHRSVAFLPFWSVSTRVSVIHINNTNVPLMRTNVFLTTLTYTLSNLMMYGFSFLKRSNLHTHLVWEKEVLWHHLAMNALYNGFCG